MSCCAISFLCASVSRPSRPPWIRGCSVFTRPSRISGAPVYALTCVTFAPAAASVLAVPPVDRTSNPSFFNTPASSTTPRLSDTETSARRIMRVGYHILFVDDTDHGDVDQLEHALGVVAVGSK